MFPQPLTVRLPHSRSPCVKSPCTEPNTSSSIARILQMRDELAYRSSSCSGRGAYWYWSLCRRFVPQQPGVVDVDAAPAPATGPRADGVSFGALAPVVQDVRVGRAIRARRRGDGKRQRRRRRRRHQADDGRSVARRRGQRGGRRRDALEEGRRRQPIAKPFERIAELFARLLGLVRRGRARGAVGRPPAPRADHPNARAPQIHQRVDEEARRVPRQAAPARPRARRRTAARIARGCGMVFARARAVCGRLGGLTRLSVVPRAREPVAEAGGFARRLVVQARVVHGARRQVLDHAVVVSRRQHVARTTHFIRRLRCPMFDACTLVLTSLKITCTL